jgi:death-on-curing protein
LTLYLTFDQVLAFHLAVTHGDDRIRDVGLIASAVARPQATAFGEDAYANVWEKAAALLQSLACNHGFIDGNKRTAWVAAMTFLEANGHPLDPMFDQLEAEEFVVAVAEGTYTAIGDIAAQLPKYSS